MGKDGAQHNGTPAQGVFEFYRDLPARPIRPERLFFGLLLDAETSVHVERFRQQFLHENHLKGTQIKTERLHVSLHHVGDYKRLRTKYVYAAKQAGKAVSMHPFEVNFRFIKSFEGTPSIDGRLAKCPLVLLGEGEALFELHQILGAAMEKNGLRAAEHFIPHMTLLYGSKLIPFHMIEPIRFVVKEFKLIHSELWLARYNERGSWALKV